MILENENLCALATRTCAAKLDEFLQLNFLKYIIDRQLCVGFRNSQKSSISLGI